MTCFFQLCEYRMRFCSCLYLLHKISRVALKTFIILHVSLQDTDSHKTDVWRHLCKDEGGGTDETRVGCHWENVTELMTSIRGCCHIDAFHLLSGTLSTLGTVVLKVLAFSPVPIKLSKTLPSSGKTSITQYF